MTFPTAHDWSSPRSPLAWAILLFAALASWTCGPLPEPHRAPMASSTVGEEHREQVPIAPVAVPPAPTGRAAIAPFGPIDDGVPGLRIPIDDPSGRALHPLHDALDRAGAGEGQARLVFYGASHVASDWFTNVIREGLQQRFGDAGHGFVLPVHPWNTYRHFGVHLESNGDSHWETHRIRTGHWAPDHYGFAGVAVESTAAGAFGLIQTARDGDFGRAVSRFELYYLLQPGGGTANIFVDGRPVSEVPTEGPERRPGYASFVVPDGPHRFELRVADGRPVRIFGVAAERNAPGVIVDTVGINGARARYQLLWDDATYRDQLARRQPDFVALAYGTNEAGDEDEPLERYQLHLREVVRRVRETVPEASCLLIGPTDRPVRERTGGTVVDRPRTAEIVALQRQVAFENGCGFFDTLAFMGGPLSMVDWVHAGYGAGDHVHFTRLGYERLGEALLFAMLHGFERRLAPSAASTPVASVAGQELRR